MRLSVHVIGAGLLLLGAAGCVFACLDLGGAHPRALDVLVAVPNGSGQAQLKLHFVPERRPEAPAATSNQAEPAPMWVPLDSRLINGTLLVQATVEKCSGWFILDTGCGCTILDETWAQKSGLPLRTFRWRSDPCGMQSYVPAAMLQVGPTIMHDRWMGCMDFSGFSVAVGVTIAGAIGGDFFAKHPVRIRYATGDVDVCTAGVPRASPGDTDLPFTIQWCKPHITVDISQMSGPSVRAIAMIDTGCASGLVCSSTVARQLGLRIRPNSGRKSLSLCGERTTWSVDGLEMELGGFVAKPNEVYVEDDDERPDDRMLIGTGVLSRYTVLIDYSRATVRLSPPRR